MLSGRDLVRPRLAALVAALGFGLTVLIGCSTSQPVASDAAQRETSAQPAASAEPATGLRLIVEPFADFFFQVRAQAAGIGDADSRLTPIVEAFEPVHETRGSWGGYFRFDVPALASKSPAEFGQWLGKAPESVPGRRGTDVPVRAPGLAMAAAMEPIWPEFLADTWPQRRSRLLVPMARLQAEFMPKHRTALKYMLDSLAIEDPEVEVPMYLVLETHPPGASTYRSYSGPVAVLSTNDLLGEGRFSDLMETLLHETCHALDGASQGDGDAFTKLRAMLEDRGIPRSDERWRGIPHLVMFVQSEETMRRVYDPDHIAYGDTQRGDIAPLYERWGDSAVSVRRHWRDFLDDKIDRETALTRIADDAAATSE